MLYLAPVGKRPRRRGCTAAAAPAGRGSPSAPASPPRGAAHQHQHQHQLRRRRQPAAGLPASSPWCPATSPSLSHPPSPSSPACAGGRRRRRLPPLALLLLRLLGRLPWLPPLMRTTWLAGGTKSSSSERQSERGEPASKGQAKPSSPSVRLARPSPSWLAAHPQPSQPALRLSSCQPSPCGGRPAQRTTQKHPRPPPLYITLPLSLGSQRVRRAPGCECAAGWHPNPTQLFDPPAPPFCPSSHQAIRTFPPFFPFFPLPPALLLLPSLSCPGLFFSSLPSSHQAAT